MLDSHVTSLNPTLSCTDCRQKIHCSNLCHFIRIPSSGTDHKYCHLVQVYQHTVTPRSYIFEGMFILQSNNVLYLPWIASHGSVLSAVLKYSKETAIYSLWNPTRDILKDSEGNQQHERLRRFLKDALQKWRRHLSMLHFSFMVYKI